jgi:hypothetical protein
VPGAAQIRVQNDTCGVDDAPQAGLQQCREPHRRAGRDGLEGRIAVRGGFASITQRQAQGVHLELHGADDDRLAEARQRFRERCVVQHMVHFWKDAQALGFGHSRPRIPAAA